MEALEPRAGGLYVDGTFGAGGYARALLDRGARVIALDRDPSAIRAGAALAGFVRRPASSLSKRASANSTRSPSVSASRRSTASCSTSACRRCSSTRRRAAFRCASTRRSTCAWGRSGRSAADILRDEDEATIADILFHFGEERAARRIARAIVADRETKPFTSTLELAGMIARVAPARRGELTHPATRAFQALRIAVNDELGELVRGLVAAERLLKPGGRLAVVTFHSLEDRIVKQFLAGRSGRGRAASRRLPGEPAEAEPTFEVPRGQPIEPGEAEARANPRSRSAKLRFGVRTGAPPRRTGRSD